MNTMDLYEAIANVDEKYTDKIMPENGGRKKVCAKTVLLKRVLPIAACFVIAVAAVIVFKGNNSGNSAVFPALKAYAVDGNNELKEYDMPQNKGIKLPEIELGEGFNGFLFAVEKDKNEPSDVQYLSTTDFASKHEVPGFPHDEINEIIDPCGKDYFYYMPDASEKDGDMISFSCYKTEEGEYVMTEYSLLIVRENGEYTVTLHDIKSFPAFDPNLPVIKENDSSENNEAEYEKGEDIVCENLEALDNGVVVFHSGRN